MQRPSDKIGRKMIPRWRPLRLTPGQELVSSKGRPLKRFAHESTKFVLDEWVADPTIWSASDMVAMGLVDGRSSDTDAAAQFLKRHMADVAPGTKQLVLAYFDDGAVGPAPAQVAVTREIKYRQIREMKDEIALYPRNAILYVELARAYVSLGQAGKARQAFDVALAISPSNRYVLRSAVRFFVLDQDVERAWSILKKSPTDDLWLLASRVAIADMGGKPIESSRRLREIIDRGRPAQVTELAAALATLEMENGADKLAKKLFKRGCEKPTDNTIAQVRWAHETSGVPFNKALLQNALTFEARTGQAVEEGNWLGAVHNASIWLGDEPFSTRAAATGAFIAAEILQNFEVAETVATSGLVANAHDPVLLNNRAYSRACLGNLVGALDDIQMAASVRPLEETDVICITATSGCIAYRGGDLVGGADYYQKAVEAAFEQKYTTLAQRALIHWIHEEGRIGRRATRDESERFSKYFSDPKRIDRETSEIYQIYAAPYLLPSGAGIEVADLRGIVSRIKD